MSSDRLRPEDIDAAIAATEGQGRRRAPRLDPADLTPLEVSYRSRAQRGSDAGQGERPAAQTDDAAIPPYPAARRRPDIVYPADEPPTGPGRRHARLWPMLAAGFVLAVFAAIIWWAYGTRLPEESGPPPLITADAGPDKIRPETEGGLQVPFQDKLIYSEIGPNGSQDSVERLLPPPATPMEPPPSPVSQSSAQPEATAPAMEAAAEPQSDDTAMEAAGAGPPAVPTVPVEQVALGEAPSGQTAESVPPAAGLTKTEAPPAAPTKPSPPAPPSETAKAVPKPETAAAKPAPVGEAFRVQLAALRTPEAAQTAWSSIRGRHSKLLDPLRLTVVRAELGDKGTFYRVQAGPLADRAAAESLCAKLKKQDQACLIVKP